MYVVESEAQRSRPANLSCMQPGRSRPRSGVRGGGLWGPLHPYAALATSAFAAGTRFRAQAAAGRPRNAPTAHSGPILGVF